MRFPIFLLFTICSPLFLSAQQEDQHWNLSYSGYIKDLQSYSRLKISQPFDTTFTYNNNLLHQRLKLELQHDKGFSLRADLRQRLFIGDGLDQDFLNSLDRANDFFDLSASALSKNERFAWHLMLDRLYASYYHGKWEVSLGRQRINWGVATLWNPNDLFNAYSFTDFDYEERPGSDALWLRYYPGSTSSIELAVKAFSGPDSAVAAMRYRFGIKTWDVQILTGFAQGDWVLGGGWEGALGPLGFKGETAWFKPDKSSDKSLQAFAATAELSYLSKQSHLFQLGYLFNSSAPNIQSVIQLYNFQARARNLYPFRHTVFLQSQFTLSPLWQTGLTILYSPEKSRPLFLSPNLRWSFAQNWELLLIAQLAYEKTDQFQSSLQAWFLRGRFSF